MSDNRVSLWKDNIIMRKEELFNYKIFDKSNKAWVSGILEGEFEFNNQFYRNRIKVARKSGTIDYVPIIVSTLLFPNGPYKSYKGKYVEVGGSFHSYHRIRENGKSYTELCLFVTTINIKEEEKNENLIFLDGYICEKPYFRTTTLNHRNLTDVKIAVTRNCGEVDYIPCIAWDARALLIKNMKIHDRIKIYGRIQSRVYYKKFDDLDIELYRETYEISILSIGDKK